MVSSFGVEYDPDTLRFHWGRFRALARLDRKTDESLTKYYHGFVAMCRQVCRLPPAAGDGECVCVGVACLACFCCPSCQCWAGGHVGPLT